MVPPVHDHRYLQSIIAGPTVERAESAERAEELIRETIERAGIVPQTVHADRGTSMTSKKVSQLLIDLGVTRSHSRPKVSNDNPCSEANFKTIKYCGGGYPEYFSSLAHARDWREGFISYYNREHGHSGVGLDQRTETRDSTCRTLTKTIYSLTGLYNYRLAELRRVLVQSDGLMVAVNRPFLYKLIHPEDSCLTMHE